MRTEFQELEARFVELRSIGEGYLEVELPTEDSPQVTFRGDHAVVEQLSDLGEEPKSFLLVGDGGLPPDGKVEVPIMDDDAVFTGDFVMSVDRVWDAVRDFVRTGSPADLGEWYELFFCLSLPYTNALRPGRPCHGRRTRISVASMRSVMPSAAA